MLISISANKPTIANTRKELEKAIAHQTKVVRSLSSTKDNPSVSQNYYRAEGILEALQAVQDMLHGNKVSFNLLSK